MPGMERKTVLQALAAIIVGLVILAVFLSAIL
jgi:hypothetical protein